MGVCGTMRSCRLSLLVEMVYLAIVSGGFARECCVARKGLPSSPCSSAALRYQFSARGPRLVRCRVVAVRVTQPRPPSVLTPSTTLRPRTHFGTLRVESVSWATAASQRPHFPDPSTASLSMEPCWSGEITFFQVERGFDLLVVHEVAVSSSAELFHGIAPSGTILLDVRR